ncbi:MAG: hypothetical protein C0407_04875 [Desulfobacca sp.]|nr:hypothetical protein [Desulfobacca sp.]
MKTPDEKEITNLCRRFGTIAVKNNFISKIQLKEAMIEQLEEDLSGKEHRLIGAILFERGWMTWEQVDLVLKELFTDE